MNDLKNWNVYGKPSEKYLKSFKENVNVNFHNVGRVIENESISI